METLQFLLFAIIIILLLIAAGLILYLLYYAFLKICNFLAIIVGYTIGGVILLKHPYFLGRFLIFLSLFILFCLFPPIIILYLLVAGIWFVKK